MLGYPTLALVAAMARGQKGALSVTVCMTGGHGEWFVQTYGPDGLPFTELASLAPAAAASTDCAALVAGTQAEALVAQRGAGQALPLHPDARCFALLPAALIGAADQPRYGRAPDARLPA